MNLKNMKNTVRWVRRNRKLIMYLTVIVLVAILASCLETGQTALMAAAAAIIPGSAGGKHVVDGPLTTDLTREASPSLLLNEIDQQITKIRPMSTPIDQISRFGGAKHAGSMIVDYYNVDTKPTMTSLAQDYDEVAPEAGAAPKARIKTLNNDIFDERDTILVQGVSGYAPDGVTETADELVLYVTGRDDDGVVVMAINGKTVDGVPGCVPDIPEGTTLI